MTVALIMVTKDFYLKNGLLYFSSQDEEGDAANLLI